MHVTSLRTGRSLAALATLTLVLIGCGGGGGSTDPTPGSAATPAAVPTADAGGAETSPEATPEAAVDGGGGGDTGPAAAPGEGRLVVNGKTYTVTITECEFATDGPTKGSFEIKGTEAGGATFEMVQFYLNDDWSQSSVTLDFGGNLVYVQRSAAREGAVPATVDGANITWTESYRDLDVAANSQVELGEGVLNLTCS